LMRYSFTSSRKTRRAMGRILEATGHLVGCLLDYRRLIIDYL
jgi:hypothetical protein